MCDIRSCIYRPSVRSRIHGAVYTGRLLEVEYTELYIQAVCYMEDIRNCIYRLSVRRGIHGAVYTGRLLEVEYTELYIQAIC